MISRTLGKLLGFEKYIKAAIFAVAVLLLVSACMQNIRFHNLKKQNAVLQNNTEAYKAELDNERNRSIQYEMSLNEMRHMNDSISKALVNAVSELKKCKVQSVQYISTEVVVHDSIVVKDTLFVPSLQLDTTLTDNRWYSVDLSLQYPGTIEVTPTLKNAYTVVMYDEKVPVGYPRKFFLWRWLQKKETVVEAVVTSQNPYCVINDSRFIKVIR